MPNWCNNIVCFQCNESTTEELKTLFEAMAATEAKTEKGQIPAFIQADIGHMFYIRWEEGVLYYDIKWCSNISIILRIAEKYKIGFTHSYEELGNLVYGEATYKDGVLTDLWLESSDFEQYCYDNESDQYGFENRIYESQYEILETLLDRKKQLLINKNMDDEEVY